MAENLLSIETGTDLIYQHVGFSTSIDTSIATPDSFCLGVSWEGTNLISSSLDTIFRHVGFSTSIDDSFSAPASAVTGVTWDGTNIYSCDIDTDTLYQHVGFTSSINDSIDSPAPNVRGIDHDGTNLISNDISTNTIYLHTGFSTSISDSFTTPSNNSYGVGWDGTNILSCDRVLENIYQHVGFSTSINATINSPDSQIGDVAWTRTFAAPNNPIIESFTDIAESGTSFDVDKPVGLEVGDLLLAIIAKDDDNGLNQPVDWSVGYQLTTEALACSLHCFYKIADSGDVAADFFTFTGDNEDYIGRLYRISGVENSAPIDSVDATGSSGTSDVPQAPSINTNFNNALVFATAGMDDNDIPYTLETAGWDEDLNTSATTAGIVIGTKVMTTTGATGVVDYTTNTSDGWHATQIAIRHEGEGADVDVLDYERGIGRGVGNGFTRGHS